MTMSFVYVGKRYCGCNVAVAVDDPKFPKDTEASLRDFKKRGYTVTRMSAVEYWELKMGHRDDCPEKKIHDLKEAHERALLDNECPRKA